MKQGQQGLKACKGSPRGGEGNGKRDGWWGLEEKEKFYKRKKDGLGREEYSWGRLLSCAPGWQGLGFLQQGTVGACCNAPFLNFFCRWCERLN